MPGVIYWFSLAGVAAVTVLGVGTLTAATAHAAPAPKPGFAQASPGVVAGPTGKTTSVPSPAIAGYYGTPVNGVASVGATIKVPTFSCPAGTVNFPFGAEILDANSSVLAQAGVEAACSDGGTVTYGLFAGTFSSFQENPTVNPGDKINLSLYETSTNIVATITDETTGATVAENGDASGTSALTFTVLAEQTYGTTAIPTFTTLRFSRVQVNGEPLGELGATVYDLESRSDVQITTGHAATYAASFLLRFKHNT